VQIQFGRERRRGDTSITAVPVGALPALLLTPSQTNASGPWTFNQAFQIGGVPDSSYITATNTSAFYADPRNRWPDNSVKIAQLSGISNFEANTQISIQLGVTGTPPGGTAVPEPTSLPFEKVVFSQVAGSPYALASGAATTYSVNTLLGTTAGWVNATTPCKIRQILNPVMSEFHYFIPVGAYLQLFYYLRAYSNGAIEVQRVIENGWFNTSPPGQMQQDYGVAMYTTNATTPDYQCLYIGQEAQAVISTVDDTGAGTLYSFSPATNEMLLYGTSILSTTDEQGGGLVNGCVFYCNSSSAAYQSSIVTYGSLTSATYTAPGAVAAYNSGTAYGANAYVNYNGWLYESARATTGNAPPAPGNANINPSANWIFKGTGPPVWTSGFTYAAGNYVMSSGYVYQCTASGAGVAGSGNQPTGSETSNTYWNYILPGGCFYILCAAGPTLPSSASNAEPVCLVGHTPHTRWERTDWYGGVGAPVVPAHNPTYLISTELVPNYGYLAPDSGPYDAALLAETTVPKAVIATAYNPYPFAQGDWDSDMGAEGDRKTLGLLPKWDALYCTSADPRAYAAVVSDTKSCGRWPFFARDKATGLPINFLNYAGWNDINLQGSAGVWGTLPVQITGSYMQCWNVEHNQSTGYLAYLVEGRWPQMEQNQFSASHGFMQEYVPCRTGIGDASGSPPVTGFQAVVNGFASPMADRGAGWSYRTTGQAACIRPRYLAGVAPSGVDAALLAAHVQLLSDTAKWHNGVFVSSSVPGSTAYSGTLYNGQYVNAVGFMAWYNSDGTNPEPEDTTGTWSPQFMLMYRAVAYASVAAYQVEGLSNQSTDLVAMRNNLFQYIVGLCGSDPSGGIGYAYPFRNACLYDAPFLNNALPFVAPGNTGWTSYTINPMTPAQMWAALATDYSFTGVSSWTAEAGQTLCDHNAQTATVIGDSSDIINGYWAAFVAALALAVDAEFPGAQAAWNLITGASNYVPLENNTPNTLLYAEYNPSDQPVWMFVPRNA
jgi:hypothetical protein